MPIILSPTSAGKSSYLELVNKILPRISQAELTSGVSLATGQAKIIASLINEAQNELWTETTNWHSLYKMRVFNTVSYSASTISFTHVGPDYITDSANGFGSFQAGQTIMVSGSTSNDGVYIVQTVTAGRLTLQSEDTLTTETFGDAVTIYAVTYPLAADWGRTAYLTDTANNKNIVEEFNRMFDEVDPQMSSIASPSYFSIQGDYYRFDSIPGNGIKILERYWAVPQPLSGDSDVSELPLFCENFIIHWAWMSILDYLNKFEQSDRIRMKIYGNPSVKDPGILQKCKSANSKILDKMFQFQSIPDYRGLQPPKFPAHY